MFEQGIITLTTDIGWHYAAQMKGVILKLNPTAKIIDITHDISAGNIPEGAFILRETTKHFPAHCVHIAIVDPGVGTVRKALLILTKSGVYIGPDNGLLIPAVRDAGIVRIYEIKNPEHIATRISRTFHGRDIFAPVGALISTGVGIGQLAIETENFVELMFDQPIIENDLIIGKIVYIDKFGNIITNITRELFHTYFKFGDKIRIVFQDEREITVPLIETYEFAPSQSFIVLYSSFDYLELAQVHGNAQQKLNLGEQELIKIRL